MKRRYHLDTDFFVWALSYPKSPEARRLDTLVAAPVAIEMSALAWYEFLRGPRTPEQLALSQLLIDRPSIIEVTADLAERAAEIFRRRRSTRRRAADVIIAATALSRNAVLLTRNVKDYADLEGLELDRLPS